MFSYMFSCVFIYYVFHIPFSFICFLSFLCTILCTFHILYSCTVLILFSYIYIHVLFISYTVFLLYFSYGFLFHVLAYVVIYFHMIFIYRAFHILYFSYTIILYFTSCSCNCLYFHRIAGLCFLYHVIYSIHVISF